MSIEEFCFAYENFNPDLKNGTCQSNTVDLFHHCADEYVEGIYNNKYKTDCWMTLVGIAIIIQAGELLYKITKVNTCGLLSHRYYIFGIILF